MTSSAPLVSVIVPSYNQARFLRATLLSIVEQDYRPLEILVCDGASTDGSAAILAEFERLDVMRVWIEPDNGVVDAVNKGLARSRGEILSIQSSDDLFLPGAMSAAVAVLRESPNLGLVYGDIDHIDADSTLLGADIQGPFDLDEYLGRLQYIPQPGTFFTRAAQASVGGWRGEFSYCADADFWIRIARQWPVGKVDRRLAQYRHHDAQRDALRSRLSRDWCAMIAELLRTPDLPPRSRRFARMGVHLARYRYAPDGDWWVRTREVYRAALANPGAVSHPRFPRRGLLPGRDPIWRELSRIKRRLGLAPR